MHGRVFTTTLYDASRGRRHARHVGGQTQSCRGVRRYATAGVGAEALPRESRLRWMQGTLPADGEGRTTFK